ncbi:MAG: glutamate synthase-related protein [Candidatus Nezhaarchaeota archaeon]|nr:glutamate synthase-related protein [Candidatus Nezhaarchaeota archaeon]
MSTTSTRSRVEDLCPSSGMCPLCIRECPFLCEISLASFRGREALYPDPLYFGRSTAASLKDYWLDWSHFNILSRLLYVKGIEEDPDVALFPNVDVEAEVGGVRLKLPVAIGAYGSTEVARVNWDGLAIGGALSGVMVIAGENICGVDPESRIEGGKVTYSKELKRRVDAFRKFWDGKYGDVAVQTNVEDQRLGVDVYAISKLEVNIIERKWGQGAKAIGGEIRVSSLERALELKRRGYVIIPDPEDKGVQEAFKQGVFKTFERHSRVGIPKERAFIEDVEWLREQGAKVVGIKTGCYSPEAVAFTMKVASEARVDYVAFDGAGGGTGMSPVPMMNEMGTPTVYLEAQVLKCAEVLRRKGRYVPDVVMAGGFVDETQIFKAIAMSNFGSGPYVKAVLMARAPLTAVMKASFFAELAEKGKLPKAFEEAFGSAPEKFFIMAPELKAALKERFEEVPWGAVGLYTYLDKVKVGLQQLMAGARKWKLNLIDRGDLVALTERASRATGIPMFEDLEQVMESLLS